MVMALGIIGCFLVVIGIVVLYKMGYRGGHGD